MAKIYQKYSCKSNIEDIYSIITDVEKYSQFISFCYNVDIIEKDHNKATIDTFIKYGFMKEKYRSLVIFSKPQIAKTIQFILPKIDQLNILENDIVAKVQINTIGGVLKYMDAAWYLISNDDITHIYFDANFDFSKKIFNYLPLTIFQKISKNIYNDFIKRVKLIY